MKASVFPSRSRFLSTFLQAPIFIIISFAYCVPSECSAQTAIELIKHINLLQELPQKANGDLELLLLKYDELIKILRSANKKQSLSENRIYFLDAGEIARRLDEWPRAKSYCETYLVLASPEDKSRSSAEHCRDEAKRHLERSHQPGPLSSASAVTSPSVQACPNPPAIAPGLPAQQAPPSLAISAASASPPALTLTELTDCETENNVAMATACFRQVVTTHTSAGSSQVAIAHLADRLAMVRSSRSLRRNDAMWGSGLTLWLSALIPSVVFGSLYMAQVQGIGAVPPGTIPDATYGTLIVPVIGPFVSATWFSLLDVSGEEKARYAVPWILASGVPQVVGLALLAVGSRRNREASNLSSRSARVLPLASPQQIGLSILGSY